MGEGRQTMGYTTAVTTECMEYVLQGALVFLLHSPDSRERGWA